MNFKFFCTAGAYGHGNWMQPLGGVQVGDLSKADVILFGGGADIRPSTYGEKPADRTHTSPEREKIEVDDFHEARRRGIKSVGICRGHQLLCALAGGKLIQDVTSHSGTHPMSTYDDQEITVNSLHHQMINPYNLKPHEFNILGWSTKRRSKWYIGGGNRKMYLPINFQEIEAIEFPKINALGFQYHPEMMYDEDKRVAAVAWTQSTFLKFLEDKI